ncbi:MAG: hypothetical protein JNJ40_09095 [Bacteroidia bacterium]|nr:hypothetical protein [Bacteroidia bacterium]
MRPLPIEIYETLGEVISSPNFLQGLRKLDRDKTAFGYINYNLMHDAKLFASSCGCSINNYSTINNEISFDVYISKLNKLSSRLRKSMYGELLISEGELLINIISITLKQIKYGSN